MAKPWEQYSKPFPTPQEAGTPWAAYQKPLQFDDKAVSKYAGKPGYDVVYMSPDQYLELAPGVEDDPAHEQKRASLTDSVQSGKSIDEIPSLDIRVGKDGAAKVIDQDGRHRALMAKEQGLDRIPVTIKRAGGGNSTKIVSLQPMGTGEPVAYRFDPVQTASADNPFHPEYSPAETVPELEGMSGTDFLKLPPAEQRRLGKKSIAATNENLRAGMGKAFTDVARGAGQLVGLVSDEDVAESRRLDRPLMETGAGKAGMALGDIAVAAPAALVPGANTVVGSALTGGALGALQPTTADESRLENALVGGALGGGITAGARALPALKRGLFDPLTDKGVDSIALSSLERFAADPASLERVAGAQKELLPGSPLSLAEITRDPGLAQLQRSSQAAAPEIASRMAEARTQRLAARQAALEPMMGRPRIGDQPSELEELMKERELNARRLYDAAFDTGLDMSRMDKGTERLVRDLTGKDVAGNPNNPFFQQSMQRGAQLARAEGHELRGNPSINFADDPKSLLVSMHYGKQDLADAIERAKSQGRNNEARILTKTMDNMDTVLRRLSPKYESARASYEAASKPIDRLRVGQYINEKLVPELTNYGAEELTPNAFANATRDLDQLVRRATGSEASSAKSVLKPSDIDLIENMKRELGGEKWARTSAAVPGSPTAQYLTGRNLMQSIAGPVGLPQSWMDSVLADMVSNRWISLAAKPVESKVASRIGEILADPSRLPQRAPERQIFGIPLSEISRRAVPAAAGAGAEYGVQQ